MNRKSSATMHEADAGGAPAPIEANMTHHRFRYSVVLIVLLLASPACRFSSPAEPSIVGTWQGTYEGDSLEMTFEEEDRFVISVVGGQNTLGHYQVDTSTTPIQLSLTLDGGGSILTIVEFVDEDTVRLENTNPDDPLPTSFSDYIELHRVNP